MYKFSALKMTTLFLSIAVSSCDSGNSNTVDEVAACTEQGITDFWEIGFYPTLSGAPNARRSADEEAAERCVRTTTAL